MKLMIRFLVGAYLCAISLIVNAEQNLTPLTLLTSPLPVFSEQQDNGRLTGYSVEYARSVFQLAGYQTEVASLPFARLMWQLEQDDRAVATGIGRTPEREDKFFWIAPMTANVIGIYSRADDLNNNVKLDSLDKLTSVGVLRGDYRFEILRQHDVKNIVEFNNWEQAIGAVLKGRIDSIFFSELGIAVTCRNANLDCTQLKKTYTYDVLFSYMAIPKTDSNREHAIRLANAAEHFINSNEFSQLTARWLPQLQLVNPKVSESNGVLLLGEIDRSKAVANNIWVLTHLEPPFSDLDERGKPAGYAVELVKGILTEAGMRQQILTAPWQRIIVESQMKPEVLVFSLARTKEREDDFYWISPITQNAYSVFTLSSNKLARGIAKLDDLPPQSRIAVLANDFREQVILDAGHVAVSVSTWQLVLQHFLSGDADYLFFSDGGIDIICQSIQQSCEAITRVFQYQLATTYLAVSKQGTSQQLVDKLTTAADNFKRSAEYRKMAQYWLDNFEKMKMPNMHEHDGIIKLWANNTNE